MVQEHCEQGVKSISSLKLTVFISAFLGITVWPLTTAHLSAVNTAISQTFSVTQSPLLRKVSISSWCCAVMPVLVGFGFFPKPFQLSQEHITVPSYEINQMKRVTALSRAPPRKAGQFILLMAWGICNRWEFLVMELIGQSHRSSSLWEPELTLILCASFNFSALYFETSSLV